MNGRITDPLEVWLGGTRVPQWSRPMNGRITVRAQEAPDLASGRNGAGR